MSPNAYLSHGPKTGLLCGYPGDHEGEEPTFVWTYSVFEDINGDAISPSMYDFLAGYVNLNMSKEQLYDIQAEDYCEGDLEEDAIAAYYQIELCDRVAMHVRTLETLRAEHMDASIKQNEAMNWILDHENQPFDPTSPIYGEICDFVRDLITRYRLKCEDLDRKIHEEENWTGGVEVDE